MTKKTVSSAYTRSLNDELPMLMLGLTVIQSIATVKSAGAYIHTYMYKHLITHTIVKRKASVWGYRVVLFV